MKIIDISQSLHENMPVYPGDPEFEAQRVYSFTQGDACEVSRIALGSHCGTHVDAPSHMLPNGESIDAISLNSFIGPCCVLTMPCALIEAKMLEDAQVQCGERILLRTDPSGAYSGNGPASISLSAAQYLAKMSIKLVGIDTPSIEDMEVFGGEVHRKLLRSGIAILEGLCLQEAVDGEYMLSALPLKMKGENGSPCRAVLIRE